MSVLLPANVIPSEGAAVAPSLSDSMSVMSRSAAAPSLQAVVDFTADTYGITVTAEQLRSERDENYRLTMPDGAVMLLKLAHPGEDERVVDFQTQALLHIARIDPELPVQRLIPSRSGRVQELWTNSKGGTRLARLFTYLAGKPIGNDGQSEAQASELGRVAADLDRALESFTHPAAGHHLLWDLGRAAEVRDLLDFTPSTEDRRLAKAALDAFVAEGSLWASLRSQVIHNDLNPHNVITDPATGAFAGIIDFGDMVAAPLVNEVAVASAYLLQSSPEMLGHVPAFVAAYQGSNPLTEMEVAALPKAIAARNALTIAITNWRASKHPENRDYILRNQARAVAGLQRLQVTGEKAARELLLDVCASVPR